MKNLLSLWNDFFDGSPSYRATSESSSGNYRKREERNSLPFGISPGIFHKSRSRESSRTKSIFLLMLIGFFGILSGCIVLLVDPYDLLYKFKIKLSNQGEIFELWRKPPVELYLRVFLFNITNRDAFLSGKEKLKVQEVGPYVYREYMEHKNISFNENGTVTSIPSHPLEWAPEMSNGTEKDILMLPNIALLSFANVILSKSYLTRMAVNLWIRQTNSHPIVEMTAREFMFGYKSTLVTVGNRFLPNWIIFDKLGLIDRMYDFKGDVSTFYTGEKDISKGGLLATYNRSPKLPQWDLPCGQVQESSDGTKFPSFLKPNDTVRFFRKSLCRSIPMVTNGKVSSRHGLKGYVYHFEDNALDNGLNNKENKCFCRKGKCLPLGLIDVTDCYYGFPIALSYPHYYKADPKLLENVEGSNPDPEKHKTYIVIQPKTGLPLEVAVRMQINMAFDDLTPMVRVGRFKNMVLPLLWTETRMHGLTPELDTIFRMYINVLPVVQSVSIYLLFAGGLALLAIALIKLFRWSSSDRSGNFAGHSAEDKEMKSLRSPLYRSKVVISDMIDEGKQAIFGKRSSKGPKNHSVYRETTRRRSSLTGFMDMMRGLSSQTRRKSKSEIYDRRKSKDDGTEANLLKNSTDSETDSGTGYNKRGDPFYGEDNKNFSEIEDNLTTLLNEGKSVSQEGGDSSDCKSDTENFELDLTMLDTIKEDAL